MSNTTSPSANAPQSATERADALLTRWGQRLKPTGGPTPPAASEAPATEAPRPEADSGAAGRADGLLGRMGHRLSGRGLIETAAYGYVALAIRTGRVADAVQTAWQESVQNARTQQIQEASRPGGKKAARRTATDERTGENILKGVEKDVTEDAAQDVATAAGAAV